VFTQGASRLRELLILGGVNGNTERVFGRGMSGQRSG
jgi:hypothetical protein